MKQYLNVISFMILMALLLPFTGIITQQAKAQPGNSDNGMLIEEWHYDMQWYAWGYFGSSPAIANLPDVNSESGEPDTDLEIVTGSDECGIITPEGYAYGLWYCFDSQGGLEWYTDTQSDESRGSVAIVDINNDGNLEIVGGTTSGETVEVMDRFGNFIWTFPDPPHQGNFMWPAAPAVIDVDPENNGLEVIIGNRPEGKVYALDGDNSDGADDGYSWTGGWPWMGTEGTDWDILWVYYLGVEIYASTAVGDVDGDGEMEAVVGSTNGTFVVLDAKTGTLETSFTYLDAIYASAALADLDGNGLLDIVVGSVGNGNIYCIEWDGTTATTKWTYNTGGSVFSSAAIGDVDGDGALEIVVGSNSNNVYCLDASGSVEWITVTGGAVFSSPSLARRTGFGLYGNEWPMFRNNPARTGLYGGPTGEALGVYVGSEDDYFYLIDGIDGSIIDRFQVRPSSSGWYRGVHTSAAVADVDGDMKLEFFFTDWGNQSTKVGHTFWAVEENKPPVADPNGPYLVAANSPLVFDGTGSSDPDGDALTFDWDWGDGTTLLDAGPTPEHTYTDAGIYDVCLTVTDGNLSDTKCTFTVVYDPSAGFVTGGGWIDSPEGAYVLYPDLTGKATFGFVSKYKKGQTVPTGNTEFQFHAGDLNFHSSEYEWLVIAGAKAMFKGTGTINGEGSYKFMVSAIDGNLLNNGDGLDKFRIKISCDDDLVYDNQVGEIYDDADPTTIIGGGSIVIHKGGKFSKPIDDESQEGAQYVMVPEEYSLLQNYPNPFNPTTTIRFAIPQEENVLVEIYNTTGQRVTTLVNTRLNSGFHEVTWDASDMPTGIYFYRIKAGQFQDLKKMILTK